MGRASDIFRKIMLGILLLIMSTALLLTAIEEHPELPKEDRGNLLGECDLILSFLCYNDISAMSRLHRSASIHI